jgi:hypothetical protein
MQHSGSSPKRLSALNLPVHETRLFCHCTHIMLNEAIIKLNRRMAQVCGTTRTYLIAYANAAMLPG